MFYDLGKLRAKRDGDVIVVRALLRHPMETGARPHPATGEPIPRSYIREVRCEHNDRLVLTLDWGWGVSANPYLSFRIRNGRAGDRVAVRWIDDRGEPAALAVEVA